MPTDLDLRFILPGPIQCQRKYPEILTCLTDLNPRRHLALPNTDRPFRATRVLHFDPGNLQPSHLQWHINLQARPLPDLPGQQFFAATS